MSKAMRLKAKIRKIARKKNIPAQVIHYMFERLLVRLSASEYQEKFVLKGGMLVAATAEHRGTAEQISDVPGILHNIKESPELRTRWDKYRKQFAYAQDISYEQIMDAIKSFVQ